MQQQDMHTTSADVSVLHAERDTRTLPVIAVPTDRRLVGIYDSETAAFTDARFDLEQEFISWERSADLSRFIAACRRRARIPLLGIEPWVTASGDANDVLMETVAGANDAMICDNVQAIKAHAAQPMMIRFAAEMDRVGYYPWSVTDHKHYIRAYQRYVDLFKAANASNVVWLWSPAGMPHCSVYYPGDDYVDYIGVSILACASEDTSDAFSEVESFHAYFEPVYERVMGFGKPIIIADFGIAHRCTEYQVRWLSDAIEAMRDYPLLNGFVYFNAANAPSIRRSPSPDFRLPRIAPAAAVLSDPVLSERPVYALPFAADAPHTLS